VKDIVVHVTTEEEESLKHLPGILGGHRTFCSEMRLGVFPAC